ncbi:MAG: glycosyl transferase [Firmicutes bacterium HGW-Firmicutes-14]|jgi:glycosyltransferase involved in cell wall biosynthesis|nr:MAG: glycosyl transferase [Firmicutes bacterium HGW-Firmicutes-14]
MHKISIITVCKNSEKTIGKTIESVLSQNYPDLEYIIVDGKSTDSTLTVVEQYQKEFSNIFKVISEQDRNMTEAFNKGWRLAGGDIIGFLNSDDQYAEGALAAVEKAFIANGEPDFVVGNCEFVNNIKILSVSKPTVIKLFLLYIIGCYIPHPSVFFNKCTAKKIGYYNEDFRFAMDLEYWVRALKNNLRFVYIDKTLSYFFLSEKQLSTRYFGQVQAEAEKIYDNKFLLAVRDLARDLGFKEKIMKYYDIKIR